MKRTALPAAWIHAQALTAIATAVLTLYVELDFVDSSPDTELVVFAALAGFTASVASLTAMLLLMPQLVELRRTKGRKDEDR